MLEEVIVTIGILLVIVIITCIFFFFLNINEHDFTRHKKGKNKSITYNPKPTVVKQTIIKPPPIYKTPNNKPAKVKLPVNCRDTLNNKHEKTSSDSIITFQIIGKVNDCIDKFLSCFKTKPTDKLKEHFHKLTLLFFLNEKELDLSKFCDDDIPFYAFNLMYSSLQDIILDKDPQFCNMENITVKGYDADLLNMLAAILNAQKELDILDNSSYETETSEFINTFFDESEKSKLSYIYNRIMDICSSHLDHFDNKFSSFIVKRYVKDAVEELGSRFPFSLINEDDADLAILSLDILRDITRDNLIDPNDCKDEKLAYDIAKFYLYILDEQYKIGCISKNEYESETNKILDTY